jgi:hypothetical protein
MFLYKDMENYSVDQNMFYKGSLVIPFTYLYNTFSYLYYV